jgi:hypothetical protein
MAPDVSSLWDFSDPQVSEMRFRQALAVATGDDALILRTQIARTYGLRRNFEEARTILAGVQESVPSASPEAPTARLFSVVQCVIPVEVATQPSKPSGKLADSIQIRSSLPIPSRRRER